MNGWVSGRTVVDSVWRTWGSKSLEKQTGLKWWRAATQRSVDFFSIGNWEPLEIFKQRKTILRSVF
jgi:hypothetical protein